MNERAVLPAAIRAVEELLECRVCGHDFSGQMIALLGRDNLPMEHLHPLCRKVKGSGSADFYRCIRCDVRACRELAELHPYFLKQCHAGWRELVMPVRRFGVTLGILFAGPFAGPEDGGGPTPHYEQPESGCRAPDIVRGRARLPELDGERLRRLLPLLRLVTGGLETMLEGALPPEKSSRRERMRFFFKQRHMSPVGEEDLARFLELSVTRVSQLLHEYFGCSFAAMLNEVRLEFAENALLHSATPVEKVAELSGFGTTAYFYRRFKEKYRMTPNQFRRRHRGSGVDVATA